MPYDVQLEIPYGSEKHSKIKQAIRSRKEMWRRAYQNRITQWNRAEEIYRCFLKTSEQDALRKDKRKQGKPDFVTITIPYSYAILLTAHTYWTSVFLGRNPVFQYSARHGGPEMAHQAVEAVIDYQAQVGEMIAPLYVWLLDKGKYGVGIMGNYWCEEMVTSTQIVEQPVTFMGIPVLPSKTKKVRQKSTMRGYHGNKLYNVRPQDWICDPRVPMFRFQDGEFCGRLTTVGWNALLKGAQQGRYFNLAKLKAVKAQIHDREPEVADIELPHVDEELERAEFGETGAVELCEMCIELSPKDWGISDSIVPEKWVFTLADNEVVIGAQPLGLYHNKFPFVIDLYEVDGYTISPRGMLEVVDPLNETMSWLFNTHFYNVRKVLNGTFVVDPSRIQMSDMKDSKDGPGGAWRLKPSAYGSDIRTVIAQMDFRDVTVNHMKDSQIVAELIQRVLGVNDNVMGMLAPGGRKTATEVRTSSSFGVNRLKTGAEFTSALGFGPLSQMLLQNTQQRFDQEMLFKVAGDLITGPQHILVTPESISGFFDFVPVDGTLPVDRFAQANLWKEILMMSTKAPQLAAQYNMGGIFEWMAQLAGLKNIKQFKIQLMPDQAALAAEQSGELQAPPAPSAEGQPGMGMVGGGVGPTG